MALIKDNTNGKFKKILNFTKNNPAHIKSFDTCLDALEDYCKTIGSCECTLTACFAENEIDFFMTDRSYGRIGFDKHKGFNIKSNNPNI
jgi:hypothetical protein